MGFRLKLMLAMLAVVGVTTAVTLTVALDRVEATNDRLFRGRVEAQLKYLPREQEARVGAVRQKAGEFAALPQVRAALEGRAYVIPDDVKALAVPVLRHRLTLSPAAEIEGRDMESLVAELVEATEAPR